MLYQFVPALGLAFQAGPAQTTASNNDGLALVGWLLGLLVAAGVLALVARPLLVAEGSLKRRAGLDETRQAQATLEGLYERVAVERKSLEELEFDHELGNLTEEDYLRLKQKTDSTLQSLQEQVSRYGESLVALKEFKQTPVVPRREVKVQAKPANVPASKKINPVANVSRPARIVNGAEAESRLKPAVKGVMKCSECATPFKPGDRFCEKCGAPLPHICLNCGAELKDDQRFCAKCGAAVND